MILPSAQLTVSKPCQENWSQMVAAKDGRYCAACEKVVIDFTQQTDAEIIAYLRQHSGLACGRFKASQLNRPLRVGKTSGTWRKWLAAAATIWGLREIAPDAAVAQRIPAVQQPLQPAQDAKSAAKATAPIWLRGVMLDSATLAPIPGATVLVKGTTRGVSTDAEGRYNIDVEGLSTPLTLTFASVGYYSEERIVRNTGAAIPDLVMRTDLAQLNDIVVVGGCGVVRPWWHPLRWYSTLRIKARNLVSR